MPSLEIVEDGRRHCTLGHLSSVAVFLPDEDLSIRDAGLSTNHLHTVNAIRLQKESSHVAILVVVISDGEEQLKNTLLTCLLFLDFCRHQ